MNDEPRRAHLEMVQAVITRMASNSFYLKGWSVLLISGLFGLAAADVAENLAFVAYLPTLTFWLLDSYYLRQERLFRHLYDRVRTLPLSQIDYSMDTSQSSEEVADLPRVAMSRTELGFYGPLLVVVVAVSVALAT